jgi:hypothetical protein
MSADPLGLFRQRLPRMAYAMDRLGPMRLLPKAQAILYRYVQAQPRNVVGALPFDIDVEYAAIIWDDANLPPPNLVVINPENAHAHYLYQLRASVFLGEGKPATRAAEYLRMIQRAMIFQLKADPSFSGFTVKNPLHPHWKVWSPASEPYDLDLLHQYLNPRALKFARKKIKPSEEIGLGRNVALFNAVRHWSYRWALAYREAGDYPAWAAFVLARALEVNAEFKHPLEPPEVRHTAKSISKWTWEKFSRAGFSQSQAARQKKQAEARRISTRGRLINLAKEMQEAGKAVNLNELAEETNIHLATVYRHLAPLASPQNAKTAQGPVYPDMANAKSESSSHEIAQRIRELSASGWTQRAIAAEVGVSQSFVFRTLRKLEDL